MKRTLILLMTVMASMVTLSGQDHTRYDEAVALLDAHETDSLKAYLEKWEAEDPENVEIVSEVPEGESAYALVDSTGNYAGYIANIYRDLNNIDEAVKYYTMLKESDDPKFAPLAAQALEELENQ